MLILPDHISRASGNTDQSLIHKPMILFRMVPVDYNRRMNITIIGTLIMLSIVCNVQAQSPRNAADSAQTEILQLTGDWNDAIIKRDSLVLDKILASDYSLNGLVNRAAWM